MKFKIKIIITIIVSFVVIVSMSLFILNTNSISISGFNSDTVITGSNNSYLITLKGVPSGNGTYPQLITINNHTKYGINNNGSNIEFFDYNNMTHLYAWIQNINISTIQVWVKNYNASSIIEMQVLQSYENEFSMSGYISNVSGQNIFSYWQSFAGLSAIPSGWIQTGGTILLGKTNISFTSSYSNALLMSSWKFSNNFIYGSKDLIVGRGNVLNGSNNFLSWISTSQTYYQNFYGALLDANNSNFYYYQNGTDLTKSVLIGDTGLWYDSLIEYYGDSASLIENWQDVAINLPISSTIPPQYLGFLVNTGSLYIQYAFSSSIGKSGMPTYTIISLYHSVDFKLLGSIISFQWSVLVNGTLYNATSSNIYLNMTNGNYGIIVNLPAGYSAITKGVLYVNGTNQVYNIFVSYNNNSGISNDIIYAIILASIIVAVAIYFSKRS